jgi:hypothetical protein
MLAGAATEVLRLRLLAVVVWLVALLLFGVLSLVAYQIGWADGAKSILTFATGLVGGGGVGTILGEKSGAAPRQNPRRKGAGK